ncbi:MAG: hypothetical protein K0S80_2921 [Neobacillus sp.]|nr:hypothetical protein [Neobacillus sp.]
MILISTLQLPLINALWDETIEKDDLTEFDEATLYDLDADGSVLFHDLIGVPIATFIPTGSQTGDPVFLKNIGRVSTSTIDWTEVIPVGTSVLVETNVSLDLGATWLGWKTVTNHSPIPDLTINLDVSNGMLQIRKTLSITDGTTSPSISDITFNIQSADTINVHDTWTNDMKILAKFGNTLEAGNIDNLGVKIVKFKVMRRESSQEQVDDIYLGEVEYDGVNNSLEYTDSTQPNKGLVYSIIPVGENDLDGNPREVSIESDFSGVWIVDRNTNKTLVFDKAIGGSVGNIESTVTQDRTVIETFGKRPQVYYGGDTNYETFTLTTVVLPDDSERTEVKYKQILNNFILDHKPKIVKTDTGRILVCDISNFRTSTPMVTWDTYDYIQISVDITEVDEYLDYMKEV